MKCVLCFIMYAFLNSSESTAWSLEKLVNYDIELQ